MDDGSSVIVEVTTLLDDVDVALVRLSEGTYRSCETCGAALLDEQLVVDPTRRRCDNHLAAP